MLSNHSFSVSSNQASQTLFDLFHQQGISACRTVAQCVCFFLYCLNLVVCEIPRRSAVFKVLKTAHWAPTMGSLWGHIFLQNSRIWHVSCMVFTAAPWLADWITKCLFWLLAILGYNIKNNSQIIFSDMNIKNYRPLDHMNKHIFKYTLLNT